MLIPKRKRSVKVRLESRGLPCPISVKALLRIAVLWNIPFACNRASADFVVSSPLMSGVYQRQLPDYEDYTARVIEEISV